MKTTLRFLVVLGISALHASPATLVVPGDANLFGAGYTVPPAPGGGSAGALPPTYEFLPALDKGVTFSVSGRNALTVPFGFNSPDGSPNCSCNILSYGGISGITHERVGFLARVFLGPDEPGDVAPLRLDFFWGPGWGQTFRSCLRWSVRLFSSATDGQVPVLINCSSLSCPLAQPDCSSDLLMRTITQVCRANIMTMAANCLSAFRSTCSIPDRL